MNGTKSLFASTTIWGAALSVVAAAAGLAGYSVSADDQAQALDLIGQIVPLWDRIVVIIGGGVAIWGRIKATRRIG
ncbi:MAG: hypothetical protein P4L98_05445 [Ancalomicrobiaceae bacterium]|nr:hypothetical protein [Ancalomicrobiaceae bacterium]